MHLTSSWHNPFVDLVTYWLYPIVESVTLDFRCTTVSNLCSRQRGKIIVLSSASLLGQMPCWSLIADTHMKKCMHSSNQIINQPASNSWDVVCIMKSLEWIKANGSSQGSFKCTCTPGASFPWGMIPESVPYLYLTLRVSCSSCS